MKTEEDEAFDELARKQGAWGGGFQAKRQMAADKLQEHWRDYFVNCKHCGKEKLIQRGNHHPWCACGSDEFDWGNQRLAQPAHCQCTACKNGTIHASDCAVHNGPAYPAGPCDCGVMNDRQRLEAIVSVINKYLPPFGMHIMDAMSAIISLVDPLPPKRERVLFPTMLRKMWSGGEVQAWLDENVNKEKNNGT